MTHAKLKQPIRGWIDRNGPPTLGIVGAYVVDVPWSELQPVAGGPLATGTVLHQALQSGLPIKLRASRAGGAPDNAKRCGGGPWTITNPASGQSATIGAYWDAQYIAYYDDYQAKLAHELDSNPMLREVVMAEPASVFDEPFIEPGVSALPGWSLAADEAAFHAMLSAHALWSTTLQDLACNPFSIGPVAFTEQVIAEGRALLGRQLVLGNNSLRALSMGAQYDAMYAAIKAAGAPIYFQTAQLAMMGDPAATFAKAVGYGAGSVELPGGYDRIPMTVLEQYHTQLLANAA